MENSSKSWLFGREKNAKLFSEICEQIYGYAWQSELSERIKSPKTGLALNLRTVQRWASGETAVPAWLWDKLPELAHEMSAEIGQLESELKRFLHVETA